MAIRIEKEKLIYMYRSMVRSREFETRLLKAYQVGYVPGHVHIGIGQEATSIGSIAAIRLDDYFTSTHRGDKGHLIARGEKPERMMAEAFGKRSSTNKGKGGHIHITNLGLGDLGTDVGGVVLEWRIFCQECR